MTANLVTSVSENQLKESIHLGPVTALKFFDEQHVLIGYGPFLRILRVDRITGSSQEVWHERIFKRNKIHCISVTQDKSTIAVAGGRSFAIVDLKTKQFREKAINEWIIAIDCTAASELLILNSHNEVLRVIVSNMCLDFAISEKMHCKEKSILYSGSIQRCSNGHTYVAAGTVMSGVVLWDLDTREILHNLTDHEGSIFAVKIDRNAQYVISCSDDRSIKIFSFANGELLGSGWGHGSRIWSLSFYDISATSVKVFSTGEDCSARLWCYDTSSKAMKQTHSFENCHEGKHIWCGDADSNIPNGLITGGSDGKVRLLDLSNKSFELKNFDCEDIQEQCQLLFERKEVIKQFVELPKIETFVVMTNLGKLFFHTPRCGWNQVEIPNPYDEAFKTFSMLRSFEPGNRVLVCSRSGNIMLLAFSDKSPNPTHLEFIANPSTTPVKVINVLSWSSPDQLILLLVSPAADFPLLAMDFNLLGDSFVLSRTYELQKQDPKAFTPTSIFFDSINQCLSVGSRHANLAVYNLTQAGPIIPYLLRKICPGDTVTSISSVFSQTDKFIVLVTVRDGTYMMIKFFNQENVLKHEMIHSNKFTKGFVEGAFYDHDQLYLYGFRSGSFFIWNETTQLEIHQVPCGGAHRQWEFLQPGRESSPRFNFLRNSSLVSKVFVNNFGGSDHGLLISGTHGREIRSLAVCPQDEPDGSKLLASASEDATIKIGFVSHHFDVSYKWTMNNHVSGLQAVSFMNKDYFASSAANEELIIWKVDREIPNNIAVIEKARIPTIEKNPDLRVMDIASVEVKNGFIIAAGFSNSQIKLFFYDKQQEITVVAVDRNSTFCILTLEFIKTGNTLLLAVGTTDGVVTIWDLSHCIMEKYNQSDFEVTSFGAPKIKQQFHQSGVKALLVIPTASNSWTLITGGDDNSLASASLDLSLVEPKLRINSFVENAASATITSIALAEDDSIVVTSVDQIFRKWSYLNGLICLAATHTTVADTGCCVSYNFDGGQFAIVGGAGLSIFEIKSRT